MFANIDLQSKAVETNMGTGKRGAGFIKGSRTKIGEGGH